LPASLAAHVRGAAFKAPMALGILAGAAVLHVMGLIDDRKGLGPWLKLAVQIAVCACVAIFFDVRMLKAQEAQMGAGWSVVATTIWLVAITNSFNFLDNMDGLCAGVAVICGLALLAAAATLHQYFVAAWLCLMVGAIAGFLPHNFFPARVFMGDAGSLVIGFLLGVVSCLTTYLPSSGQYPLYEYFAPVVLMAVPLYDTISVMVIRVSVRSNPMVGDRRHFSHRLVKRGMSVPRAVVTIYVCTGATAGAALLLAHVTSAPAAVLVFFQTLAILLVIALFESPEARQ
jgi:UDP-GlcNAc:undecaprenyl-phosphate GlcNAc-1-phosphate transferase